MRFINLAIILLAVTQLLKWAKLEKTASKGTVIKQKMCLTWKVDIQTAMEMSQAH